MVKDQFITDNYAIYCSDNMIVMPTIPDNSIDLVSYSPPFSTKNGGALYSYSSYPSDLSNCDSSEEFLIQYEFLVKELSRVTKPGRINAVHCADSFDNRSFLWDFPHEIIRLHEKHGFHYRNRITIWKEPLKVRMRTMVQSLMHKFIIEDATKCFTAMPDYVLVFTKKGENEIPVTHPFGLMEYAGATPFLKEHEETYGKYEDFKRKWMNFKGDPRENKLSHITWQRYASSVWDDVRIDNVLPFKDSKEEDDEKHVHPTQLDVIDRIVDLWSNPGEVVLTPFMGIGSEVYSPVSMGRKAIGIELKSSYYKQSLLNMKDAEKRFKKQEENYLFNV